MAECIENYFMVWGSDQAAYGPVELPMLASWIEDGRVTSESWVFVGKTNSWLRARKVLELKRVLGVMGDTTRLSAPCRVDPQLLRRINILAALTDQQLETFARFVEVEQVPTPAVVVSAGQRDDNLYLILGGELSVELPVLGEDVTIGRLYPGDFFGDMAALNHGTRSANVRAVTSCVLARISGAALDDVCRRWPDMAAPLLKAMDRALAERVRADNERLRDITAAAQLSR